MANFNVIFKEVITDILDNGFTYPDPKRKGTQRIQVPFKVIDIDVSKIPLLTTKEVNFDSIVKEFRMFISGQNNVMDLKARFWDTDAYNFYKRITNGTYSLSSFVDIVKNQRRVSINSKDYPLVGDLGHSYPKNWYKSNQLIKAIKGVKDNHYNTDLLVLAIDINKRDSKDVALLPCHYAFQFVATGKDSFGIVMNMRSTDVFLGLPFNAAFYFLLGEFTELVTGKKFNKLAVAMANCHLYDNAIAEAKELIKRDTTMLSDIDFKMAFRGNVFIDFDNPQLLKDLLMVTDISIGNYNPMPKMPVKMIGQDNELL